MNLFGQPTQQCDSCRQRCAAYRTEHAHLCFQCWDEAGRPAWRQSDLRIGVDPGHPDGDRSALLLIERTTQ